MQLPDIQSGATFAVAVVVGWVVATAIHELGHAIAGRSVGYDVILCGVGFRRPFTYIRLGQCAYFLGWPPDGGFTFALYDAYVERRRKAAIFILGGPLATVLLAVASFIAWQYFASDWLSAMFYVASFQCIWTLIPFTMSSKYLRLRTDGALLLRYGRGRAIGDSHSGAIASTYWSFAQWCQLMKQKRGEVKCLAILALSQVGLGDTEAARETLESPAFSDPDYQRDRRTTETVARAYLAMHEKTSDVADKVAAAQATLDEVGDTWVGRMLTLGVAPTNDLKAIDEVDALAIQTGVYGVKESIQAEWIIDGFTAPDDEQEALRLLKTRGLRQLSPRARYRLWLWLAEDRSQRGDRDGARQAFDAAAKQMNDYLAAFPAGPLRVRYVERCQPALAELANKLGASAPILAAQPSNKPSERSLHIFRRTSLFASGLAVLSALFYLAANAFPVQTPYNVAIERDDALQFISIAVFASVMGLLLSVPGLVYKPRWPVAVAALALALTLACFGGGTVLRVRAAQYTIPYPDFEEP